ncbi:hypothetical protein PQE75_gp165 [Bacillus phage vB_BcoS-136]|uniref:Uncharacterized protein n=1 Tax=Bacillus phage vB_BcoS-136 TaxID=2419619 RepID=A0A3G3BVQ7_9CAUD|nr:hypothetical protein PQE75_gp165 [Bacillus phage vB_BcoS-136]AYP68314.1 hypothetical protein vBBcoS136_00200 [Bacillus phage vB_BcoS-136]
MTLFAVTLSFIIVIILIVFNYERKMAKIVARAKYLDKQKSSSITQLAKASEMLVEENEIYISILKDNFTEEEIDDMYQRKVEEKGLQV